MAGMNDAIRGFDPEKIRQLWSEMCKEPSLVVTLVPPTRHDDLNRRIEQINHIIAETCRKTISLDLADDSGRIKPEYASDGVHISPKAYAVWIKSLGRF